VISCINPKEGLDALLVLAAVVVVVVLAVVVAAAVGLPGHTGRQTETLRDWQTPHMVATFDRYQSHLQYLHNQHACLMGWMPFHMA